MGNKSNSLFAILLIVVGIIWLLNNVDVTNVDILRYWPLLLIIWGLQSLAGGSRNPGALGLSAFVSIVGVILLANNLGFADFNIRNLFEVFIPVLIIIIGLSLFVGHSHTGGKTTTAFMGGVERGKDLPWHLESGSYFAIMGGIELDLRHAVIPEGETVLDLTAVMGGIDIRVPADLPVAADGFAVLGGVEFFGKGSGGIIGSTRNEQGMAEDTGKRVKIQARAVMGGIDVKRV